MHQNHIICFSSISVVFGKENKLGVPATAVVATAKKLGWGVPRKAPFLYRVSGGFLSLLKRQFLSHHYLTDHISILTKLEENPNVCMPSQQHPPIKNTARKFELI